MKLLKILSVLKINMQGLKSATLILKKMLSEEETEMDTQV